LTRQKFEFLQKRAIKREMLEKMSYEIKPDPKKNIQGDIRGKYFNDYEVMV
jgi:hypothetical protein